MQDSTTGAGRSERTLASWELQGTVLASGAVVMLVEILGTRVIGPVFGVSLFVWAALLSVTLLALALGYYAGGVLIDRTPRASRLGAVLVIGGSVLGVAPLLAPAVLRAAAGLGPRLGPLAAALILFAPALTALGMTGPIAVRLATTDIAGAGQRVGKIYAVSTAGSLVGTLVTSFWLIPAFDAEHILLGAAAALVLLGALSLARHGTPRSASAAGAALLVPLLVGRAPEPPLPPQVRFLNRSRSLYGQVDVIEDTERGVRYLRSDHSLIGASFVLDHTPAFAFLHVMEALPIIRPAARDALVIGLGTGALPAALARRGLHVDAVEIDPAVARFAEQYFWYSTSGTTAIEDARTFVQRSERHYDIIVHDTFTGGATPEHLLTAEVLQQIHGRLSPGGVLALDMVGFQRGPNAGATWAVARTLRAEFAVVRAVRDSPLDRNPDKATNIVFFASDADIPLGIDPSATFGDWYCEKTLPLIASWEIPLDLPPGDTITDAHNPLARLQVPVAEQHYRAMLDLLPLEVWLH